MLYGAKTHLHSGRGGTVIACVLLPKPARQHKLVIELHIAKYHNFFAFKTVSDVWISLRGSTEEGNRCPVQGLYVILHLIRAHRQLLLKHGNFVLPPVPSAQA